MLKLYVCCKHVGTNSHATISDLSLLLFILYSENIVLLSSTQQINRYMYILHYLQTAIKMIHNLYRIVIQLLWSTFISASSLITSHYTIGIHTHSIKCIIGWFHSNELLQRFHMHFAGFVKHDIGLQVITMSHLWTTMYTTLT